MKSTQTQPLDNDTTLRQFIEGYIECGLWLTPHEAENSDENGYLQEDFDGSELSEASRTTLETVCKDFYTMNLGALTQAYMEYDRAWACLGHDFFLSRNGNGTGFWDRGMNTLGCQLHDATKPYGESYFYVGDNGSLEYVG